MCAVFLLLKLTWTGHNYMACQLIWKQWLKNSNMCKPVVAGKPLNRSMVATPGVRIKGKLLELVDTPK